MTAKTRHKTRKMRTEDLSRVKEIEVKTDLSRWSKEDYRDEMLRRDSICLVLVEVKKHREEIEGFLIARQVFCDPAGPEMNPDKSFNGELRVVEIYNIAVSRKIRKQGLGKMLLRKLFKIASARAIDAVWLEVRKSNSGAIGFYHAAGFDVVYERPGFYSNPMENALVMRRKR